jgi:hypothetical protein
MDRITMANRPARAKATAEIELDAAARRQALDPLVTGIQNKGDEKHGTHGTAVRVMRALYEPGAVLDPAHPDERPADSLHDHFVSMPMILHNA